MSVALKLQATFLLRVLRKQMMRLRCVEQTRDVKPRRLDLYAEGIDDFA